MRLQGKKAIVTGGAAGIGRAIAFALANEGADVAIADVQAEKAQVAAREIKGQGRHAVAITCDVGDPVQAQAMVAQAVAEMGGLDILVNNAGIILQGLFWEIEPKDWDRILRNNLSSVFYCSRPAARAMIEQNRGGRIINISSIHATLSEPRAGPYTAARRPSVWY